MVITTIVTRLLDHRTYCVRLWRKAAQWFEASPQSQKMSYETCSTDIFVSLQPFGCKKGDFLNLKLWGMEGPGESEIGPFDSSPMGSYWLPTDTYLLPLLSYIAGTKSASAHPPVRTRYDDNCRSRSYNITQSSDKKILHEAGKWRIKNVTYETSEQQHVVMTMYL